MMMMTTIMTNQAGRPDGFLFDRSVYGIYCVMIFLTKSKLIYENETKENSSF